MFRKREKPSFREFTCWKFFRNEKCTSTEFPCNIGFHILCGSVFLRNYKNTNQVDRKVGKGNMFIKYKTVKKKKWYINVHGCFNFQTIYELLYLSISKIPLCIEGKD